MAIIFLTQSCRKSESFVSLHPLDKLTLYIDKKEANQILEIYHKQNVIDTTVRTLNFNGKNVNYRILFCKKNCKKQQIMGIEFFVYEQHAALYEEVESLYSTLEKEYVNISSQEVKLNDITSPDSTMFIYGNKGMIDEFSGNLKCR